MMYDTGAMETTESMSTMTMAKMCNPKYRFASAILNGRRMTKTKDTAMTRSAVSAWTTPFPFVSSYPSN